jgi:hypothetical protein
MNATLATKFNNDLYCATAFPGRLFRRMRELEYLVSCSTINEGFKTISPWIMNNHFAKRLPEFHVTERGEYYLKILQTAFCKNMHAKGSSSPMYFAGSKEEQKNKENPGYMRPLYNDVTLIEDATHEKFGRYLNPLGSHFSGKWVKFDDDGYFRINPNI